MDRDIGPAGGRLMTAPVDSHYGLQTTDMWVAHNTPPATITPQPETQPFNTNTTSQAGQSDRPVACESEIRSGAEMEFLPVLKELRRDGK